MSNGVVDINVSKLKQALRQTIERIEAPAIDYVNWERFERDADKLVATGMPTRQHILALVASSCTQARRDYHKAVLSGARFSREKPN